MLRQKMGCTDIKSMFKKVFLLKCFVYELNVRLVSAILFYTFELLCVHIVLDA